MTAPPQRLAENVLHFARALRAGGMAVGTGRALEAVKAAAAVGLASKRDFYWALHASFVSKPSERALFDAAFKLFWRDPQLIERMMAELLREVEIPPEERQRRAAETRAQEALAAGAEPPRPEPKEPEGEEIAFDATFTVSEEERLRSMDFEQMTSEEIAAAKRAIARLEMPLRPIASRRSAPAARGRLADWRATLRASMRAGGDIRRIERRRPQEHWPDLVALCDISGSMSAYSRMLLHFLHAAGAGEGAAKSRSWGRIHVFVFGTRLTNVTRSLRHRDVDDALAAVGAEAPDWEGGTRIGAALGAFNRDWARRVLGRGAAVLLVTDGLDRGDPGDLARQADRLRLSCRKLVWLNPLLRWDGFAPRAQGVKALLPRVDSFRAAHNINSLEALAEALTRAEDVGEKARLERMMEATDG